MTRQGKQQRMARRTTRERLQIDDLEIELIRTARRRSLSLEVDARSTRVRASLTLPRPDIIQFVQSKRHWLEKQRECLPAPLPPWTLQDGCSVLLNGETFRLHLASGRTAPEIQEQQLLVPITPSHLPATESVRRKLVRWYKQQAQAQLTEYVLQLWPLGSTAKTHPEHTSAQHCAPIKVRDYKRRWGSCNAQGELSFNWRIIMAPPCIQRYLVVHELAHRIEFNHSPRFWQIVGDNDPNYRVHRRWLQDHGASLYRI